jgi:LmbE family N-acetylglucosaminyl deacetylase
MTVLVISTHPDDETLGCAGTLLKHRAEGSKLFWLIVTAASDPRWPKEVINRKSAEVETVAQALEVEQFFKLGFPTAGLDRVPLDELIGRVKEVVSKVKPETVYLVHGGDIHTDHQAVFKATMSVLKPFYMTELGVRRILCYETLSSTEAAPPRQDQVFLPNVFSDISNYLESKIDIMNLYETEVHADPLPRGPSAIRALARYRGATIGVEYAEAFQMMRELV